MWEFHRRNAPVEKELVHPIQGALPLSYSIHPTPVVNGVAAADSFRLLDDTQGKIRHVLLHYQSEIQVEYLLSVMETMDSDVKFTILCDPALDISLLEYTARQGKQDINLIDVDEMLTMWPQDRIFALTSAYGKAVMPGVDGGVGKVRGTLEETEVVKPDEADRDVDLSRDALSEERRGDQLAHLYIQHEMPGEFVTLDKRDRNIKLSYFQGGDVLTDENRVYVGGKTLITNLERRRELYDRLIKAGNKGEETLGQRIEEIDRFLETGEETRTELMIKREIARKIGRISGNRVIRFIGTPWPPLFHADLYMKPIGEGKVVVGDVRMAIHMLKQKDLQDLDVGRLLAFIEEGVDNRKLDVETNVDKVAEDLSRMGLDVIRIPLLAPAKYEGEVPNLSYTNVEIENYETEAGRVKRVYMPRYGIETLDLLASDIWGGLGFEVKTVEGLLELSRKSGSLRCSEKVLERI